MSATGEESLQFRAMTFGVDCRYGVMVGFEMDRRPGHDSRGLLIFRGFPGGDGSNNAVYVEFGEPQQYCMEGGIQSAQSVPGKFRMKFTKEGAEKMAGIRIIEVEYDETDDQTPELLKALDYIFNGFGE